MANDRDLNLAEGRPIEVNMQPPGHERRTARAPVVSGTRSGGGFGTVLASGALAFLLGGAGAWVYHQYLDPIVAKQRPGAHQTKGQDSAANPAFTDLAARVDELSGKLDRLQTDVGRVSSKAAPPDLEPMDKRISALEDLPRKVEALDARVASMPTKIDQDGRKITALMADVDGVRTQVSSLRSDIATKGIGPPAASRSEPPPASASSEAPREIAVPVDVSLQPGIVLFKQGKYDHASELFSNLTASKPDDARVWYYAALARGLATRDWKGEAEKLVTNGVEREKAGKPAKSEIDSAFSDLTSETGKDWLAFYRRRAH